MIKITCVEFENFRQYRSIKIDFTSGADNDLHILRAKNGTGKTTFLNGILWCLYGKEYYINDSDTALPLVNNALIQQSDVKATICAKVRLTLNDEGEILTFERAQAFHVVEDPITHIKNVTSNESKLKVIQTSLGLATNSKVFEDEAEVQSIVKQYFDEAIHDYYFFDGENLKSYFDQGKSAKIRSSIYNISQVTLLTNASSHVQAMADERSRKARSIDTNSITDFTEVIYRLETDITRLEEENGAIEKEQPILRKQIEDADEALQNYAPIKHNIQRRAMLDKELTDLERDYEAFVGEKNTFITNYLTWLNFYPRAKATYEYIQRKQDTGTLPPSIDKEQVKTLLNQHMKNCPVCNGVIDDRAISHLRSLLERLDVSSATSNFLMEIKAGLEMIIDKCRAFPDEYQGIVDRDNYYAETIAEKKSALDDISAFLSKYSDENGKIDVQRIENERKRAEKKKDANIERLALNKRDIELKQELLAEKREEREKAEEKIKDKSQYSAQVSILRKLRDKFDVIQSQIMGDIKKDIQAQTWNRFSSMIWKKKTFGSISINDSYELSVYNLEGNEMTGSLSATEYMALAYSFTLAIHDASGKNCPLVVDSPLGRVSDDNRVNMANELLKVAKQKQIIMLFTPDEYSDEVKNLYDEAAASIREINLSSDEDQIVGVI